jgi:hypothetical protein
MGETLSTLPPGLNEFSRLEGRAGVLDQIRRSAAAAIGRALVDGVQLIEIEFPPLLETKTQFDDFSNVEVLDANRDWTMQLALEKELRAAVAVPSALWLVFADDGEAALAREAWPGKLYAEATQTSIATAVSDLGGEPLKPMGTGAADFFGGAAKLFGGSSPPSSSPPPAMPPALQLVVQPGDGGPMEDWLNLELLKQEECAMVCVNGALDKVCSGYYSNFLNPKLGEVAARFFARFEQALYLKPISSGRGWLYRIYPEPWQLHRQTREGMELVETYEERPTLQTCAERLKRP